MDGPSHLRSRTMSRRRPKVTVTSLLRGCAAVSQLFRGCFAGLAQGVSHLSRVFRGCFAGVSRVFCGSCTYIGCFACFAAVSRCLAGVSRCLAIVTTSVPPVSQVFRGVSRVFRTVNLRSKLVINLRSLTEAQCDGSKARLRVCKPLAVGVAVDRLLMLYM